MTDSKTPMHYVCTWDEAAELVKKFAQYWVCNCGCREGKGRCTRSRMDVCLTFAFEATLTGSDRKQITAVEVGAILDDAREKYLVARPFRDDATRSKVEGICFCCDDCCDYFLNPEEICDKGASIEQTDMRRCTHCGDCEPVCYFGARVMEDDILIIDSEKCYGCGLCVAACPVDCIEMVTRN
ncbi:MAG: 4Fe-4S binding protein [Candidatus Zixiibacteriota bacterium]|nr:MAG: 4Fe-4S binding protein [candidate division Zixibacteria bacterium]